MRAGLRLIALLFFLMFLVPRHLGNAGEWG